MRRENRKQIFLLVSHGGLLDNIEKEWEKIKESDIVKNVSTKIKNFFKDEDEDKNLKDSTIADPSKSTTIDDRKKSKEKEKAYLSQNKGNLSYQPPIKSDWKSSGNWYTGAGPNHPHGHQGIDMRAPRGTPVYPAAKGRVCNIDVNSPIGGNTVSIVHQDGKMTYYAHLDSIKATLGQKVDSNTVIGTVGNSGNAKGTYPHLHFGIREFSTKGSWKDPAGFFSVPAYSPLSKEERGKD